MVNFCAIVGCNNRADKQREVSFYRLPAIISHQGEQTYELSCKRRDLWLSRIHREDLGPNKYPYVRVCSHHFISGKPSDLYDKNNPDWAPSLHLGGAPEPALDIAQERYARAAIIKEKRRKASNQVPDKPSTPEQVEPENIVSTQTDEAGRINLPETFEEVSARVKQLESSCQELKVKCERLEKDNSCHVKERKIMEERLQETLLDEESFRENDDKVLFYTGLTNWRILFVVFTFVQSHIAASRHTSLSPFQQLLLTLMRLRLSLSVQDLGYRFGIHKSTVCRIFSSILEVLFVRLKCLIVWPSRDVLRKTLPMDFRKHCPKCVVIIDCFEIFIDRPTDLLARAQTYSSYKHHNTVKYLIGITPQGSVSFISQGWGGRVSDKHLTQNSGLLNNLLPGDTVLADRGFDIKESVGLYCATLVLPAFTKGKRQLSGIEVEQTRKIANVRIHVERVIGNLRQKYSFLGTTQPIDHLVCKEGEGSTTLDKIVTVCCSLTNLCNSVVPTD